MRGNDDYHIKIDLGGNLGFYCGTGDNAYRTQPIDDFLELH